MYEIYKQLRDARGVTDYAVAKACGFKQTTFTEWEKASRGEKGVTPKIEKMLKLADYFDVSLDYLVRGKEKDGTTSPVLTVAELQLLSDFRDLNAEGQKEAIFQVKHLLEKGIYIKRDLSVSAVEA